MALKHPKTEPFQPQTDPKEEGARAPEYEQIPPDQRHSTVGDLLQFAGTWVGDDLEECLEAVYASRSQVEF